MNLIVKLEKAAESATPGPWFDFAGVIKTASGLVASNAKECPAGQNANGRYIELANPENILKLCKAIWVSENALKCILYLRSPSPENYIENHMTPEFKCEQALKEIETLLR